MKEYESIESYKKSLKKSFKKRIQFEMYLANKYKDQIFSLDGYCKCCKKATSFTVDWMYSDGIVPNFRERMLCSSCNLNNRTRFIVSYLDNFIKKKEKLNIYLYEEITPFYQKINELFSAEHNITGSEYLGFDKIGGQLYNNIRHEDAQALSFLDKSLDLIVSQDVLEHVPNYVKSLEETYRVLKDGGQFLFTIPFSLTLEITKKRSILQKNGELVHLLPESYHGNPVDKKGSLVFHDFGCDLFNKFIKIGFKKIKVVSYYNYFYGHLGDANQYCFVAIK